MRRAWAVVIDLDDTLLATDLARRRGRRALRRYQIDPRGFAAAEREWIARYLRGECGVDDVRAGRMAAVGLTGALAAEADLLYRTVAAVYRPRSSARRLLRGLRSAGIVTAILTNGTQYPQAQKIRESGFLELVDAVVYAGDSGIRKPDVRAFQATLDVVGGAPERALSLGDSYEHDIRGALELGFAGGVWLTRRRPRSLPHQVDVVRGLEQALERILARCAAERPAELGLDGTGCDPASRELPA